MTDTTNERVKRALYLKEEISGKETLYDEDEREITRLNSGLPAINTSLYHIRQKISCLTMINHEMAENVFSQELLRRKKDLRLNKLKTQLKVLREITEEQIDEERILNERGEEIEKRKRPHELRKIVLYEELCELREEYEISLLEMNENEVPEELRTDYENVRDTEEEDSVDQGIVEVIEDQEPEELKVPKVKTFFMYDTCCACQEEKPDIFNIPCGHVCMCVSCNTKNTKNNNTKCAICRNVVKKFYAIKSL